MRKRFAVLVLSVAALVVTATPAAMSSGFDPDPGEPGDTVEQPPQDALARDRWFESLAESGAETIEQARTRTEIQAQARLLSAHLHKVAPDTFGGIWIAIEPPFHVHVAFVGGDASSVVQEIAADIGFAPMTLLRVRTAQFSWVELLEIYDSIGHHLPASHKASERELFAWVDVRENVVQVRHPDPLVGAAVLEAVPEGSVSFEAARGQGGNSALIRGGEETRAPSCTTGFIVRKNLSIESGVTTAAHCDPPDGLAGVNSPSFGPQLATWSGNTDPDIDTQWLSLAERAWVPKNQIVWNDSGNTLTIKGRTTYSSINVGDYLCKYGWATGDSCGYVESTACCHAGDRFIEVGSPMTSQSGDSGGPVYELVEPVFHAVGSHKGGSFDGDPIFGAVSFFESDFNVKVATSGLPTPAYDWLLRSSNSQGLATTVWEWAETGSIAVVGRWLSSSGGADQPGFFKSGTWDLEGRTRFTFGSSGDTPVPGDWDNDGIDEAGVFRSSNATFYRRGSSSIAFGNPGDVPVVGDWDGDGDDEVGVFRPTEVKFYLRASNGSVTSFYYGTWNDLPVVGDWDDDGVDEVGVFRPSTGQWFLQGLSGFYYGLGTDNPLPGDWDGDGRDTVGVTR